MTVTTILNASDDEEFEYSRTELGTIYFKDNLMIERVEDDNSEFEYSVIKDSTYTEYSKDLDEINNQRFNVYDKNKGVIFFKNMNFKIDSLKQINDTILDDIHYKRFTNNTPYEYCVLYLENVVKNIPYSFNKEIEEYYKCKITRLDVYDKNNDIFTSIILSITNEIPKQYYLKLNDL